MHMFNVNRRYNPPYNRPILRFNTYIQVSHTNGRSIKNMIGVVVNRLVGMGLSGQPQSCQTLFLNPYNGSALYLPYILM